jgi:hypothetical protein
MTRNSGSPASVPGIGGLACEPGTGQVDVDFGGIGIPL